jgi:hypothetical protein
MDDGKGSGRSGRGLIEALSRNLSTGPGEMPRKLSYDSSGPGPHSKLALP